MPAPTDFAKLTRWGVQTKVNIPTRFAQAFKMDRAGLVRFYVNNAGELCLRLATQEEQHHAAKKHPAPADRPAEQPAPA